MEEEPYLGPESKSKRLDNIRAYIATDRLVRNSVQIEIADGSGGIRKLIVPRQAIIDSGIDFDADEEDIDPEVFKQLLQQGSDPALN